MSLAEHARRGGAVRICIFAAILGEKRFAKVEVLGGLELWSVESGDNNGFTLNVSGPSWMFSPKRARTRCCVEYKFKLQ